MSEHYYWTGKQKDNHMETLQAWAWTTEPPTKAGLYKARHDDNQFYWGEVVLYNPGIFIFYSVGSEVAEGLDNYNLWLGPIPEPELPKG